MVTTAQCTLRCRARVLHSKDHMPGPYTGTQLPTSAEYACFLQQATMTIGWLNNENRAPKEVLRKDAKLSDQ